MTDRKKEEAEQDEPSGFRLPRLRDLREKITDFQALPPERESPRAAAPPAMPRALAADPVDRLPDRTRNPRSLGEKFSDAVKNSIMGLTGVQQEFSVETTEEVKVMPVLKFKMSFAMA